MNDYTLRFAVPEDAAALLEIYAPYVRDTAYSLEYEVPDLATFRRRVEQIAAEYPYLVCLERDRVVGYAYAHRYQERAAYQWNAELSVYLDGSHQGRGLGSRLTRALMALLRLQNVCTVYSLITSANTASLRMVERLGFRSVGRYERTGFKFGRWYDVSICEYHLTENAAGPLPLLTVAEADRVAQQTILTSF